MCGLRGTHLLQGVSSAHVSTSCVAGRSGTGAGSRWLVLGAARAAPLRWGLLLDSRRRRSKHAVRVSMRMCSSSCPHSLRHTGHVCEPKNVLSVTHELQKRWSHESRSGLHRTCMQIGQRKSYMAWHCLPVSFAINARASTTVSAMSAPKAREL